MEGAGKGGAFIACVRGLPWSATGGDLGRFFRDHGVKIEADKICLCTNKKGKPSGHAYVRLETQEEEKKMLGTDGRLDGGRNAGCLEEGGLGKGAVALG